MTFSRLQHLLIHTHCIHDSCIVHEYVETVPLRHDSPDSLVDLFFPGDVALKSIHTWGRLKLGEVGDVEDRDLSAVVEKLVDNGEADACGPSGDNGNLSRLLSYCGSKTIYWTSVAALLRNFHLPFLSRVPECVGERRQRRQPVEEVSWFWC